MSFGDLFVLEPARDDQLAGRGLDLDLRARADRGEPRAAAVDLRRAETVDPRRADFLRVHEEADALAREPPHVLDLDLELALALVLELRLAARARERGGRLQRDPDARVAFRLHRRRRDCQRCESEERDRENDRALHDCLLEIGYSTKLMRPAPGAGYAKAKSWFSL